MIVRNSDRIKRNSPEFKMYEKLACDVYLLNGNASAAYTMFRRIIDGNEFEDNKSMSVTASAFFARDTNALYLEQRRKEILQRHFEEYLKEHNIDAGEFTPRKEKIYNMENITSEELRAKNLDELEEIKNNTTDDNLKANIIKQQTDLMNAKKRSEEAEKSTDKYIVYHLPMPHCNECPHRFKLGDIIEDEDGHED